MKSKETETQVNTTQAALVTTTTTSSSDQHEKSLASLKDLTIEDIACEANPENEPQYLVPH